jgi:hypothetical protein
VITETQLADAVARASEQSRRARSAGRVKAIGERVCGTRDVRRYWEGSELSLGALLDTVSGYEKAGNLADIGERLDRSRSISKE